MLFLIKVIWVACRAGVGNSFVSAGHIRDKLGIQGPVHLLYIYIYIYIYIHLILDNLL